MGRSSVGLVTALTAIASPALAQQKPAQSQVIGTWLLESIVDTLADGSVTYWMGPRPTGAIMYTPSGYMSVQFMRDPRPQLPAGPASADAARIAGAQPFRSLPPESMRTLLEGYYAYFGRYQVSPAGDSVFHFVESSLRPHEVGTTYRRAIRIQGERLFISLHPVEDGVRLHRILTWRRAPE